MPFSPLRFRASLELTLAADDLDAASAKWDELSRCAEDLGFNVEGGDVGLMDAEDVAQGSPLAKLIGSAA